MPDELAIPWSDIGNKKLQQILWRSVYDGSYGHAYLMYGPNGVGKRSIVTLFIQSIICEDQDRRPCGICPNCRLSRDKMHPDIMYVHRDDDARDITIEQIRSVNHFVRLKPVTSRVKIVLLDGADSMNHVAANALLKTIEEPPEHVVMILIATNIATLPSTIVSRCQLFKFSPLTKREALESWQGPSRDYSTVETVYHRAYGKEELMRQMMDDSGADYRDRIGRAVDVFTMTPVERIAHIQRSIHAIKAERQSTSHNLIAREMASLVDSLEMVVREVIFLKTNPRLAVHSEYRQPLLRASQSWTLTRLREILLSIDELRYTMHMQGNIALAWDYFLLMLSI